MAKFPPGLCRAANEVLSVTRKTVLRLALRDRSQQKGALGKVKAECSD